MPLSPTICRCIRNQAIYQILTLPSHQRAAPAPPHQAYTWADAGRYVWYRFPLPQEDRYRQVDRFGHYGCAPWWSRTECMLCPSQIWHWRPQLFFFFLYRQLLNSTPQVAIAFLSSKSTTFTLKSATLRLSFGIHTTISFTSCFVCRPPFWSRSKLKKWSRPLWPLGLSPLIVYLSLFVTKWIIPKLLKARAALMSSKMLVLLCILSFFWFDLLYTVIQIQRGDCLVLSPSPKLSLLIISGLCRGPLVGIRWSIIYRSLSRKDHLVSHLSRRVMW